MPSGNRKPLTVDEVTWKAAKGVVEAEDEYDTYDDFVRDFVERYNEHTEDVLEEGLAKAVSDGTQTLEEVED